MDEIIDGLYVGDITDARKHGANFEHVLTLSSDETDGTTEHLPIVDGKNEQEDFDEVAEVALDLVNEQDGDVLIHCSAGVSRSTTTIATVIAKNKSVRFSEALKIVEGRHPETRPVFFMRQHAKEFLGEETESLDEYIARMEE